MAERRMFAKTIIDSDAFLDMPLSTQAVYFHLSMRADDDGFINNPKKIQRMVGGCDDDLKLLIAKRFIIPFESGIVVIKHWKIHNYIRNDRYKETVYQDEKAMLSEKENKAYTLEPIGIPNGRQTVYQTTDEMDTQVRLGKDRSIKDSLDKLSAESSEDATAENHENASALVYLPLIDGTQYGVSQSDVGGWTIAYPAVDVIQELHKMRSWLDANPKNKKTARGIKRFIVNWLGRSQDSARKQPTTQQQKTGFDLDEFFEAACLDSERKRIENPPKTAGNDEAVRSKAERLREKLST